MTFADFRFAVIVGTLAGAVVIGLWVIFYQAIVSGVFQ